MKKKFRLLKKALKVIVCSTIFEFVDVYCPFTNIGEKGVLRIAVIIKFVNSDGGCQTLKNGAKLLAHSNITSPIF